MLFEVCGFSFRIQVAEFLDYETLRYETLRYQLDPDVCSTKLPAVLQDFSTVSSLYF
jgi:hypothetical protein